MTTKKKTTVGTSVLNPTSAPAQNTEVGTGSGAALANPVPKGPPSPGAPIVPAGAVPRTLEEARALKHPLPIQVNHVRAVATELAGLASQPAFAAMEQFGMLSPVQLSGLLVVVANWSDESKNAVAWSTYARSQRSTLWDTAIVAMDQIGPLVTAYVAANPTAAASLSATQAFVDARGTVAQRAATTRNAPKVAQARATTATARATKATQVAAAETAIAAARRTGDATITQPAPAPASTAPASTTPVSAAPASTAPASGKGGITLT